MARRTLIRAAIVGGWTLGVLTSGCGDSPTTPSRQPTVPTVTQVVPSMGPTESNVDIRIVGTGFQPGATLILGSPLTNVVVTSSTLITATAPPHPAGAVDVVVTNRDGRSARLNGGYTYVPVAVTAVSPKEGLAGSSLTIVGTGFLPDVTVRIGGVVATVTHVTPTSITATIPSGVAGTVDVAVTNPGGQGGMLAGAFTLAVVTLTAATEVVSPGGGLTVSWVAPAGRSGADWIGLFRVGAENTEYGWWSYTGGATSGTFTLSAPAEPGEYEFRYLLDDGYVDVARSGKVTVRADGG